MFPMPTFPVSKGAAHYPGQVEIRLRSAPAAVANSSVLHDLVPSSSTRAGRWAADGNRICEPCPLIVTIITPRKHVSEMAK